MSLFGVNNINNLVDCTKVLPSYQETFSGSGTGLNPVCNGGPVRVPTTTGLTTSTVYTSKVYTTSLCLPLLPCPSILKKVITTTYPIATPTFAVGQANKRLPTAAPAPTAFAA
jgi:hypothetical protein